MKKRFRVSVVAIREFTRIVKANTEREALRLVKENIRKQHILIRAKDFDKYQDQVEQE